MTTKQIHGFSETCREIAQTVGTELSTGFDYLGRSFRKLEGIDRLFKFIVPIGDLFVYILGAFAPFTAVRGQFKGFNDYVNFANIFTRGKEWSNKDDRKKMFDDWKEMAKKVTLTVANVLTSINFLHLCKVIDLGQIAAKTVTWPIWNIVSTLSPIMLVADGLIVVSSLFSLSQQPAALEKGTAHLEKAKKDKLKAEKWQIKLDYYHARKKIEDEPKQMQSFADKLKAEYKLKKFHLLNPANGWGEVEDRFNQKWAEFQNKVQRGVEPSQVKRWEDRAEMWSSAYEVHRNTRKKAWLTIANDVVKIAIISFAAIALSILGITTAPVMVPFILLGITAGTLGIWKFLFDDIYKDNEESMKELFVKSHKKQEHSSEVHPGWMLQTAR